jgi:hypothetical protein
MEDITGLGKLAESKLANDVYHDGLASATQETGAALTDVAKMVRLVTGSAYAATAFIHERISKFCEKAVSVVPPERRIPVEAAVAGPALLNLRFLEDGDPLAAMYVELLRCAVDRDRVRDANPAFVKIIEQLSPEEVLILNFLRGKSIDTFEHCLLSPHPRPYQITTKFPADDVGGGLRLHMFLTHLEKLSLITLNFSAEEGQDLHSTVNNNMIARRGKANFSDYGMWFSGACCQRR